MSAAISVSTGKHYGLQRVCEVWDVPRSSFYGRKKRFEMAQTSQVPVLRKRGPKTPLSDAEVLELIRADLATTLFKGEGHRKVWRRIRYGKEIKVGRKRVLRLMRENNLLSPYRVPQAPTKTHDGKITTLAPNVMWGTDATKIFTLEDGWCWLFSAVEHFNAECVGWHVTKTGDRFAALQPISMGLMNHYGSIGADVARGLALRMDHGSQYLSEHFLNQVKFWGIAPSFAFVGEPQTNGVVERFNRTLKEQAIYGLTFRNIEEVRTAVAKFVYDYNNFWQVEKLGFKTPSQARNEFNFKEAA